MRKMQAQIQWERGSSHKRYSFELSEALLIHVTAANLQNEGRENPLIQISVKHIHQLAAPNISDDYSQLAK